LKTQPIINTEKSLIPNWFIFNAENAENLAPKTKVLVLGDSYTRKIRYSENINTFGISGSNSENYLQLLVKAGAKLPNSSKTAKLGDHFISFLYNFDKMRQSL
jgi:hypothetical protein